MTIAACYVSGEGVVLGADSATTVRVAGRGPGAEQSDHHFQNTQKVFEIGEKSTLGIVTWGMGNLGDISHRTLIALFADSLRQSSASTMNEVAEQWNAYFWNAYLQTMQPEVQRARGLLGLGQPTDAEREELRALRAALSGGFCVGGYLPHERKPQTYVLHYDPTLSGPRTPEPLEMATLSAAPDPARSRVPGLRTLPSGPVR
jgi:hypothetical protein